MRRSLGPLSFRLIREIGGVIDPDRPKKRGRQQRQSYAEVAASKSGRIAWAVFVHMASAQCSQAEAIRAVAKIESRSEAVLGSMVVSVKQMVKREKRLRPAIEATAAASVQQQRDDAEVMRRMRVLPADVQALLGRSAPYALLQLLRAEGIDVDRNVPAAFIDEMRSRGH